jgi:hypothetical protein
VAAAVVLAAAAGGSCSFSSSEQRRRGVGAPADEEQLLDYIPDGLDDDCWAHPPSPPFLGGYDVMSGRAIAGFSCSAPEDEGGLGDDRSVEYLLFRTLADMDADFEGRYHGFDRCAVQPPSECRYAIDGVPTGRVFRQGGAAFGTSLVWTDEQALVMASVASGTYGDVVVPDPYAWWVSSRSGTLSLQEPDRTSDGPASSPTTAQPSTTTVIRGPVGSTAAPTVVPIGGVCPGATRSSGGSGPDTFD